MKSTYSILTRKFIQLLQVEGHENVNSYVTNDKLVNSSQLLLAKLQV